LARDAAALWRHTVDLTSATQNHHARTVFSRCFVNNRLKKMASGPKERLGRQAIHRVPAIDIKRTPGGSISLCIP
jgi:hypothetical protein